MELNGKKCELIYERDKINRYWYLDGFGRWVCPGWFQWYWIRRLDFKDQDRRCRKHDFFRRRNNFTDLYVLYLHCFGDFGVE